VFDVLHIMPFLQKVSLSISFGVLLLVVKAFSWWGHALQLLLPNIERCQRHLLRHGTSPPHLSFV